MVQMEVIGGAKETNLRRAADRIRRAAASGARVIVLPEAMSLGWTHSSARTEADPIPEGRSCQMLCEVANETGAYVCSGLIERAGTQVFNSAILIGPDGQILLHHRKLNELRFAHDLYALGDRLQVVRTPIATFGLMICADGFAAGQVISRTLGYMGADVILSPSAWAVPADHDNAREPYGKLWLDSYGPGAKDFRLHILGVSSVGAITDGPWTGRKCIGCSLAVGPGGRPIVQAPYGEKADTIVYVKIIPIERPAQGDAWADLWAAPVVS
jgi:predicted amidohydrolase